MEKRRPYKLLRHDTFNINESADSTLLKFTYKKYKLTVYPGYLNFTLKFPDGSIISDTFQGLSKRKSLYIYIDNGGLFKWLKEREHSIELVDAIDGIAHIKIPLGYAGYNIVMDTQKKKGWILFPEVVRGFDLEDLYLQIPELPLINDSRLNHILRDKLEGLDLNLPATPYELGISVSPKE